MEDPGNIIHKLLAKNILYICEVLASNLKSFKYLMIKKCKKRVTLSHFTITGNRNSFHTYKTYTLITLIKVKCY